MRSNSISCGTTLALTVCGTIFVADANAYEKATVTNKTAFEAKIEIDYAACKRDIFTVAPGQSARPSAARGACLITNISVTLVANPKVAGAKIGPVTSYTSS